MTAADTNLLGTIHGGTIMKFADDTAGAVAARHSGRAVTASMDEMVFLTPVQVGDLVTVKAQVNWTGATSMEVGVRIEAERWNELSSGPKLVAVAYLVFVSIDETGQPRLTPAVVPEDEEDLRRWREAEIRRTSRLERRAAIRASRAGD